MLPTRTFWEKATAVHVFCHQGRIRGGDRFARHWYDIFRLAETGIANEAIAQRSLAREVAAHKQLFFAEKDDAGRAIDYFEAASGHLSLAPEGNSRASLEADYSRMVEDGLILGEAPRFDDLMQRCADLAAQVNLRLSES